MSPPCHPHFTPISPPFQGLINGFAEFRCEKKVEYEMSLANRFKSVERQRIILYLIEKALGE